MAEVRASTFSARSPALSGSDAMHAVAARLLVPGCLVVGAFLLAIGAAQALAGVVDRPLAARVGSGASLVVLGLVGEGVRRRGHRLAASGLLLTGMLVTAAVHGWTSGLGLHALALPALALLVALSGVLLSLAWALLMAGGSAIALLGLWWLQDQRWLDVQPSLAIRPPTAPLVSNLVLVACGLMVSVLIRRMAQEALGQAEVQRRRLEQLLAIGTDWSYTADRDNRLTWLSPSFEARAGRPVALMMQLGKPGGPAVVRDADFERLLAFVRERRPFREQRMTIRFPDGGEMVVTNAADPIFDAGGEFVGWQGVSRNVTDETLLRREADRRQALVDGLFRIVPQAIGVVDLADARLVLVNAGLVALSGYREDELIGRRAVELHLWADLAAMDRFRIRLQRGEPLADEPGVVRRRDGSLRDVLLSAAPFEWAGRAVAVFSLRDVTDERLAAQALRRAKADAESASQAKSRFLANMSHEIRTPLAGVLGLARLIRQLPADDGRRTRYAAELVQAAEGLDRMVSDVLDVSKIEAGRVEIEHAAFDLHALLQGALAGFAVAAADRGLALGIELAPALPRRVVGDAARVRQIVANYLSNAIKFTASGGVTLRAGVGGQGLRLEVIDTGIGVAPERQSGLFEPFVQADASTTRRYGGTGLGLSICRQLAALMGGRTGVHSDGRSGSRFWVELPLPPADDDGQAAAGLPAAAPAAASRPADQADGACPGAGPDASRANPAAAGADAGDAADPPAAQPLAGLVVLLAEDNPVNLLIAGETLRMLGAEVVEAQDGDQALERAFERLPDAAVLDLYMPGRDGPSVARVLRADPRTAGIRLVGLTATLLESDHRAALDAGMDLCLSKPATVDGLAQALRPAGDPMTGDAAART